MGVIGTIIFDLAGEEIIYVTVYLFLAGAVVMACRLFLLRREAIVVAVSLGGFFLVGFAAPLVGERGDWILTALALILGIGTVVLIAFVASARWAAALAAAVLVPLAWIVGFHGSYVAHLTGLEGLDVDTFGSDDQPGLRNPWFTFFIGTFVWASCGLAAGVIAWLIHGSIRPAPDQTAPRSSVTAERKTIAP